MTSKQLLALILTSSLTFLALVLGGGYLYWTNPTLLGLPENRQSNTLAKPLAVWEVELYRLQKEHQQTTLQLIQLRDSTVSLQRSLSAATAHSDSLQQQLTIALNTIVQLRQSLDRDSLRLKNLYAIAEMYDRADPAEVAKILAGAESSYAAAVLRLMKRKTAAKVIEQLPKDKALAISVAALELP